MPARTVPASGPAFAKLWREDGIGSARRSFAGAAFSDFNDGCNEFAELRALILEARASAMHDADAVPVTRTRLDIDTDELVMG
jgi:hypothetical protein